MEILSKKQSRRNSIKSIVTDRHIISDNKVIEEKFNNFFLNLGPTLAASLRSNVSQTHKSYLNENVLTSFQFNLVDEDHIGKIMKSLKNKTSLGHDGISIKLLKFLSPALVKPLSLIINQSLITGIFPEKLKRAKVLPLFKKGDETLIENYRPSWHQYPKYSKKLSLYNYQNIFRMMDCFMRANTAFEKITQPN